MLTKETDILIVGLGMIGGSYAKGLSEAGFHVEGYDKNENSMTFARENGYIRNGCTDSMADLVSRADVIVFSIYPDAIPGYIREYQHLFKRDVLLTDVAGVKCSLLRDVREVIDPDVTYISHHPMAGREKSGIESNDPSVFKDANFLITPDKGAEGSEVLVEIATILGFKNIEIISPKMHDEVVGYLSQLTHVIAMSLMNARDVTHMAAYTGDSFRDLTRIATINDRMWPQLFLSNRNILIDEIEMFEKALNEVKASLVDGDKEHLAELMRQSTKRRELFKKV